MSWNVAGGWNAVDGAGADTATFSSSTASQSSVSAAIVYAGQFDSQTSADSTLTGIERLSTSFSSSTTSGSDVSIEDAIDEFDIGGGANDYSTFSSFESDQQSNTRNKIANIYGTISGSPIVGQQGPMEIRAAGGQEADMQGGGAGFSSSIAIGQNNNNKITFKNVNLQGVSLVIGVAGDSVDILSCYDAGGTPGIAGDADVICNAYNSVFTGNSRGVDGASGSADKLTLHDCILAGNGDYNAARATLNNCILGGDVSTANTTACDGNYNVSSDATAPGANSQNNVDFTGAFVDPDNGDYRINQSWADVNLVGQGDGGTDIAGWAYYNNAGAASFLSSTASESEFIASEVYSASLSSTTSSLSGLTANVVLGAAFDSETVSDSALSATAIYAASFNSITASGSEITVDAVNEATFNSVTASDSTLSGIPRLSVEFASVTNSSSQLDSSGTVEASFNSTTASDSDLAGRAVLSASFSSATASASNIVADINFSSSFSSTTESNSGLSATIRLSGQIASSTASVSNIDGLTRFNATINSITASASAFSSIINGITNARNPIVVYSKLTRNIVYTKLTRRTIYTKIDNTV